MDAPAMPHAPETLPGLELAELELALQALDAEPAKDDAGEADGADAAAIEEQPSDVAKAGSISEESAEPSESPAAAELETVELELTLQHEDLVKLPFEDSVRVALDRLGGKLLFQMRLDNVEDCQRVAAVRLGENEEEQFALIIMPPGGRSIRVESAANSENPLARIAESYAGIMDAFKAAA